MARPSSITIPINSDALKSIVKLKGRNISDLGDKELLDVSRQTVNTWLQGNKIPPKKLSVLTRKLQLTSEEIDSISTPLERKDIYVQFRTNRNVKVQENVTDEVKAIAKDFFTLNELFEVKFSSKQLINIKADTPAEMANQILSTLGLERNQLSLDSVIRALKSLNIFVSFYDFGEEFVSSKAQAVCVRQEDQAIIFVNSQEYIEDVLWRIFHELCHLFSNHKDATTKEQEEFCNQTASEVLTPKAFFQTHKEKLIEILGRDFGKLPVLTSQIASSLNASFQGVILALKENDILSKKQINYLWKVFHSKNKNRKKVIDILEPAEDEDPIIFWKKAFSSPEYIKYLTLQELIKGGLVNGAISTSRAADILKLDTPTVQHLSQYWKDEYDGKINN